MKKDKISRFFGNMGFMFRRSWELSGSIYFVTALQYIIGTGQTVRYAADTEVYSR